MYKIEKEPAYQLYQFTSFLYHNKNDDFFKSYDNQAIYRSIINRTYYSSYSMTEAWLFNNHGISINGPEYYKSIGEDIVSVHVQIRVH